MSRIPSQVSMLAMARESSLRLEGGELPSIATRDDDNNNEGNYDNAQRRTRKRVRHFTTGDRAAHRVFEKARREAFREKLTELAELLPSLEDSDVSRLSKHMVVHESIARHKEQIWQIGALTRERDELFAEVTRWRTQANFADPTSSMAVGLDDLAIDAGQPSPLPLPQQSTVPALLLDHAVPLPLGELSDDLPNSPTWPWGPSLDLHRDSQAVLHWDGLDDGDVGQLVGNTMVLHAPPVVYVQTNADLHRDMDDVIVEDTSGSQRLGMHEPSPDRQTNQILWTVS